MELPLIIMGGIMKIILPFGADQTVVMGPGDGADSGAYGDN
jgi:hypothetical protein